MLSQDYQDNIEQDFYLCNVVWRFLDNIAQSFYLCDVVPSVLRQLWTGLFSYVMFSGVSLRILHEVFTRAILSQEY